MKSLISNYLNSRRSIKLDESFQITDNNVKESDTNKHNEIKCAENKYNNNVENSMENSILKLYLKFIDDNDTDSASNLSFEKNSSLGLDESKLSSQKNSTEYNRAKTCEYLLESLDKLNIHIENLLSKQYQTKITEKFRLSKQNFLLEHKSPETPSFVVNQIKSCLFYIDHFLSSDKQKAEMNPDNHFFNQNPHLLTENKLLKEKIKSLEERLKQSEEYDLNKFKDNIESLKSERKRLKLEKIELLTQTKELYKTIESKENQIKSLLKKFDTKSKETRSIIKKLIENKSEVEYEKREMECYIEELVDENNQLKLFMESKKATINKLEKQIYDIKSKSPRCSLDKESDYGYSSSKSRDTLSSSMIETNILTKTETKQNSKNDSKYKTKKEERNLKCKSNDSYLYIKNNHLNETTQSLNYTSSKSSKIKNKFKFNKLSTSMSYHNNMDKNIKSSKSNNNLSFIMSSSDYDETDLNKVLDSDEFIDLDENEKNLNKTINEKTKQNLIVSTTSTSSSSSASFNTNSSLKNLEISSTATIASVSPSVSLTLSSASSYKNEQTDSKANDLNKPLNLNFSAESETSSSDLSPMVMSQSITLCEEEMNKTSNDFSNTSRYSIKQPLSVSMSVQTPNSNNKSRSSRLLNTIIRMSTIGSSFANNRSSALIDTKPIPTSYSTTLSSAKVKNRHSHYSNTPFVSSKSSYCVRETDDEYDLESKNLLNKSFKLIDEAINDLSVNQWTQQEIKTWLQNLGMPSIYIKNGIKYLTNGKILINLNENDVEKIFQVGNYMHKRKIKLALEDLKYPDKCKYSKIGNVTNEWLVNTWLKQIGLVYLQGIFRLNLVDGRVLASLQKKDLEKYFGITKKLHQTSLLLGIELLKKYEFDCEKLNFLRLNALRENKTLDICLWTNESFIEWLKLVNLQEHVDKLKESGLHGALVAENSFNTDTLFSCLEIEDEAKYQNIRKILDDEIKLLKKTKTNMKMDSVFNRPLNSFKNDKNRMFTFRGSLGRALGKKIKRDISSPLVDDDTIKKIEFSHKIVDMKSIQNSLA